MTHPCSCQPVSFLPSAWWYLYEYNTLLAVLQANWPPPAQLTRLLGLQQSSGQAQTATAGLTGS